MKVRILGTSLLEKYWQKKGLNFGEVENSLGHPHRKLLIEKILKYNPESILEIGCGWGPNLFLLAKKLPKAKIEGIDINGKAVETGKEVFQKNNIENIRLFVGKADNLDSFKDKSFDIVFSDATLMYIGPDKIKRTIKQIFENCQKAIILIEWHISGKQDIYDAHIGVWKKNYLNLLERFISSEKISLTKITKEMWPDKNWQKWGYLTEIIL
ncbi:MAG: class I SAM-dependent methyltransferase [Minisyncoccales bacterium]